MKRCNELKITEIVKLQKKLKANRGFQNSYREWDENPTVYVFY